MKPAAVQPDATSDELQKLDIRAGTIKFVNEV